jgi:transcriptional regulator with XRE-family HTH domain
MPRSADSIDIEIGRRVRAYRIARGLSQSELGDKIGVTFQQIQKYEKGVNRIGGGRLKKIAGVLGLPISVLFGEDDKGDPRAADRLFTEAFSQRYAARLLRAFNTIKNSGQRRALVEFVESMAQKAESRRSSPPMRGGRRGLH